MKANAAAGGAGFGGNTAEAMVNVGVAVKFIAICASIMIAAFRMAVAAIHHPVLTFEQSAAAEGTKIIFYVAVVALANGLTAGKAGVVVATVAAITVTSGTFHMVALGYAHIVTARKLVVGSADSAAGRASVFSTFIVVALTKQVTAEGARLVDAAVADVCKASGALVMIACLAGLVVTV